MFTLPYLTMMMACYAIFGSHPMEINVQPHTLLTFARASKRSTLSF